MATVLYTYGYSYTGKILKNKERLVQLNARCWSEEKKEEQL